MIGGTGNISSAVSRLAIQQGHKLWCLHRKSISILGLDCNEFLVDMAHESEVERVLANHTFDVIIDWIAFTPSHIERDLRLFLKRCAQYVFISSASVYEKFPSLDLITETRRLHNPWWQYSCDKIDCEALLQKEIQRGAPITIVRPSLTYDTVIPVPIGGWNEFSIVEILRQGKPIVVHGNGSEPWTITHSMDFAEGFLPLLGHAQALGEAFHITSNEHPTWDQIHEWLAEACGCKANILHLPAKTIVAAEPQMEGTLLGDKAWPTLFDNSKIRRIAPKFAAKIPFCEGIRKTVQWFEEKPERKLVNESSLQLMDRLVALATAQ